MDPIPGRLLLVYDGSSISDRALDAGIARALASNATITLLCVVAPRLWRAKRGQFQTPPEKHDEEFAQTQLARARQRCKDAGVRSETRVRVGPPAHAIAEEASAHGYQALIMSERPSLTGAPTLARIVVVPAETEVVVVA